MDEEQFVFVILFVSFSIGVSGGSSFVVSLVVFGGFDDDDDDGDDDDVVGPPLEKAPRQNNTFSGLLPCRRSRRANAAT